MFHLIDTAISELLRAELPGLLPRSVSVTISFSTPPSSTSSDPVTGPSIRGAVADEGPERACAVNLFLFAIAKNRGLRNGVGAGQTGQNRVHGAPELWVDAAYHVSVTPSANGAMEAQTEHLVLGAILQALARHREFPQPFLAPQLRDSPYPVHGWALEGPEVNRGEFWQALSQRPRAFFTYQVTFALPPPIAAKEGKLVDSYAVSIRRVELP